MQDIRDIKKGIQGERFGDIWRLKVTDISGSQSDLFGKIFLCETTELANCAQPVIVIMNRTVWQNNDKLYKICLIYVYICAKILNDVVAMLNINKQRRYF